MVRACDDHSTMMSNSVPLLLLALTGVLAAPASIYPDDYTEIVSEKRAALMLDRLLVALHKALREESPQQYERPDRDGPQTAPLRVAEADLNDLSALQRRGQTSNSRGRVLRCYFNAVTCF